MARRYGRMARRYGRMAQRAGVDGAALRTDARRHGRIARRAGVDRGATDGWRAAPAEGVFASSPRCCQAMFTVRKPAPVAWRCVRAWVNQPALPGRSILDETEFTS